MHHICIYTLLRNCVINLAPTNKRGVNMHIGVYIYVYIYLTYMCSYSCVVSNLVPTSNHVCSTSVQPIAF